jgi:hypothetical protein
MPQRLNVLWLALLLIASLSPVRAQEAQGPSWIDGTHILAEKFSNEIATLTAMPAQAPRRNVRRAVAVGQSEIFWAMNVAASQPYQLKAFLKKVTKHAYIYVEDGYDYDEETLSKLGRQFDDTIYPTDRAWFGEEESPGIDGDKRITLLLLDIQDGWQPGKGYVAGYFFPLDGVSADLFPQSNERQMFYLDTRPADPKRNDYLGILAHEFQHMIHFNMDRRETKWINEAMAQIAFFVCGYGHAPQTFQYVRNTDVNMEIWTNSLENYGSAYLWTYYLLTKYAGASDEDKRQFIRSLVASKATGFASIQEVLKARGVEKPVQDIFVDWTVANAAGDPSIDGGIYGYDASLKFGVNNAAQTYGLEGLSSEATKEKVNAWAADYIVYAADTSYSPRRPSMIDKVTLSGAKPGSVVWNVNDRELPPAKIVPEGSAVNEGEHTVTTALNKDENGKYVVQIGAFARLGVEIRSLNFRFKYDDGSESLPKSVPIFTISSVAQSNKRAEERAKLVFDFQGEKKKPAQLRAVVKKINGTTSVHPIAISDKMTAQWTYDGSLDELESLTIVVIGLHGKKTQEYSYSLKTVSARDAHREKVFEGVGAAGIAGKFGMAAGTVAPMAPVRRAEDGDSSHDNLGYFLNKKQEIIHNLTHLMIDPNFIEGQILKLWKLLEIAQGFPHLPIPDGFAFVDYNEASAQALVKGWAEEFGVEVIGLPNTPAPVRQGEDLEQVKATVKRLVIAEKFVEFNYNASLNLAQDFGVTVYYLFKFVFGARSTLSTITGHFSNVPVVGTLAKKLHKMIIGKLVRAADNLVWFLSGKLRAPYNTFIPIGFSLIANIVARSLDIPLDPSQSNGSTKDFIIGLMAKYALASMPKVGFVARSQKAVDVASSYATGLTANGSFEDAVKKVWDDGDPNTDTSLREVIALEIPRRMEQSFKEKQIAWITAKLAEAANLITIIDPTSISRVVSIVLHVGTAGIFAHASWITVSYYFHLPRNEMLTGANQMFDPAFTPTDETKAEPILNSTVSLAATERVVAQLEDTFAEFLKEAEAIATDPRNERSFDRAFELDEQLDTLTDRAQALVFAAQPGDSAMTRGQATDGVVGNLYTESQACLFHRAGLMADLFARRAGGAQNQVALASKYAPAFETYMAAVKANVKALAARSDTGAALYVAETKLERLGNGVYVIKAVVANGSSMTIKDIKVQLYSGLKLEAQDGAVRDIAKLGSDRETSVSFRVKMNEAKPLPMPSVCIVAEAPGVKGSSKTQHLED